MKAGREERIAFIKNELERINSGIATVGISAFVNPSVGHYERVAAQRDVQYAVQRRKEFEFELKKLEAQQYTCKDLEEEGQVMTVQALIDALQFVENKELPIYVSGEKTGNQYAVRSVTLFDESEEHSEVNMLGINYHLPGEGDEGED